MIGQDVYESRGVRGLGDGYGERVSGTFPNASFVDTVSFRSDIDSYWGVMFRCENRAMWEDYQYLTLTVTFEDHSEYTSAILKYNEDEGAYFADGTDTLFNHMNAHYEEHATITVTQATATEIVVTTQPSDTTVTAGDTLVLTAEVTGSEPIEWQWQRNGANVVNKSGTGLVAEYTATVSASSVAEYQCYFKNAAGTVFTDIALVTVNESEV